MPEKIHVPKELGDFLGKEQDEAYASAFGAKITDGFDDQGVDLILEGGEEVKEIQVKSSPEGVRKFLVESLKRERFIPVCVGEPGAKEEMIASIKEFGAWVGHDIPGREVFLEKIAKIRDLCYSKEGVIKKLIEEMG